MKYNAMMAEIEKMEKQQASYEELCEELQELLNSEQDPDYIIRIAKEKLGLYFPDEEIFYNDRNG
jgi:cell division protein FtsB